MNAVEKALSVLRVLGSTSGALRLADIARQAGLERPSTHRILGVLVSHDFARRTGEGVYAAGMAMYTLGAGSHHGFVESVRPILDGLQRDSGHTVHLAVRCNDAAVYVATVEGDKPYRMLSRVGMAVRLPTTAVGKAMLATMPREQVDDLIARDVMSHGVDLSHLHEELGQVRHFGYAFDDEENAPNVRCVGAAIFAGSDIAVGGVSVSGLSILLDRSQMAMLGPRVQSAAAAVSGVIGNSTDLLV